MLDRPSRNWAESLDGPVQRLDEGGTSHRDLNGNGCIDPYEDPRAPLDDRVGDILNRMCLDEKVGLLFHPPIAIGGKGEIVESIHPLS